MKLKFEFLEDGTVSFKDILTSVLILIFIYIIVVAPLINVVYDQATVFMVAGVLFASVLRIKINGVSSEES